MNDLLVPRARLELARLSTLDPKSSASANFATSAHFVRNKGEQEEYHSTEAADNTRPTIC